MNIRYLRAGRLTGLYLMLILLVGACDNPADGNDGPAVTAATIARNAADSFYDTHRGVLVMPVDMLSLGDADPVNTALEAYKGLRADVKTLLAGEKAHLDILKAKLDEMGGEAERSVYYTLTDLLVYLTEQPENTADTPYEVAYYGNETIKAVYKVLAVAGKYAALDLSKSDVRGFNTGTEEGRELIVSLVLPDTLTETPDGRKQTPIFVGFTSLKTVKAAGLVTLGEYGFYNCASLTSISLPKAVSLGNYVFYGCTSLASVTIPEAVTIGNYALYGCTSLASATLPKAVTIGAYALADCTGLISVTMPEAVTLGMGPFFNCTSLTTANLPKVESLLGINAFYNCTSLATVSLPEAVTISNTVFSGCTSLTTVILPKAGSIGQGAFFNCTSLATVTLGTIPPTIGTGIFSGAATTGKIITIKTPQLALYNLVTPWSDKMGTSSNWGTYWDNNTNTKDNLTVALAAL